MKRNLKTNRRLRGAAFFSMLLAASLMIGEAGEFLAAKTTPTVVLGGENGSSSVKDPEPEKPAPSTVTYRKTMVKADDGSVYYYLSSGQMAVNRWVKYKGNKYYFGSDGKMIKNAWVGNYYVYLNGKRVKNITKKKVLRKSTKAERRSGKRLIIVGASRVFHMAEHVSYDKQTVYLCKKGAGIKFLRSDCGPRLCAYLAAFPHSTVVFQLGNNSLSGYKKKIVKYVNYYQKLMDTFPLADFYFMDALPSKNKKKNRLRMKFNALLRSAFPAEYIGGYDYMIKSGISFTSDGEHYKPVTSYLIYDYILKKTGWTS